MTRSIFGWSLPPGVSMRDIDPPEFPCLVCGHMSESCICPECPDCGVCGDPDCYDRGHPSDYPAAEVQLQRNEAQILGRALRDEQELEMARREREHYRLYDDNFDNVGGENDHDQ